MCYNFDKKNLNEAIYTLYLGVYMCGFTSIHREADEVCLDQLEYKETDQQCSVEDVSFLFQVPSLLL